MQDRPGQSTGGQAAAQAARQAALQALLTSVLVPCSHSPPFLAQALAVFRKVGYLTAQLPLGRSYPGDIPLDFLSKHRCR